MTISNITIRNVKGISEITVPDKIHKNKPNILVASNGFGKTSFACAFKFCADQTSLVIPDEDRHQDNKSNIGYLKLDHDDNSNTITLDVTEDAHTNLIRKEFDILVISDLKSIEAKTQMLRGGYSIPRASETIKPIVLSKVVRSKPTPYKISDLKKDFGFNSKILSNLSNNLFQNNLFLERVYELFECFSELQLKRYKDESEKIRKLFNTDTQDIQLISNEISNFKENNQIFSNAIKLISEVERCDDVTAFLHLWQISRVVQRDSIKFKEYLDYLRYKSIKDRIKDILDQINSSWLSIKIREAKGELLIDLPSPSKVSNGQRDILCLVTKLFQARFFLKKNKAILIIDELFDYLDDANIVVGQFFISQIINDFKRQKKVIYPIILTHLNPSFFRNYVFKKQNVIYLSGLDINDALDASKKLISMRADKSIDESLRNKIDKYLVHFHSDSYDFKSDLEGINKVRSSWGKFGKFQEFIKFEFKKYQNNENYDPLAICAITRRSIEQSAYHQLTEADKSAFLEVHTTIKKLQFAVSKSADIPESHFLLRIIFDDGLHWRPDRDNTIPIVAKLENPIIKKMIIDIVESEFEY